MVNIILTDSFALACSSDMVASGVPRRNGERHAFAIADMSLELVQESRTFVIPHMPKEELKIRVGIHSG